MVIKIIRVAGTKGRALGCGNKNREEAMSEEIEVRTRISWEGQRRGGPQPTHPHGQSPPDWLQCLDPWAWVPLLPTE